MAKQALTSRIMERSATPTLIGRSLGMGSPLALDQIRINGGTQVRDGLNTATVQEYTEAMLGGAQFPPIDVYHDGDAYWLADGFHRLAAARGAGLATISANVHAGDKRAAMLHAFGANNAHGLRRTNADKHRAVAAMLKDDEWGAWSNRRIADACAVSLDLVNRVRNETPRDSTERFVQSSDGRTMNVSGVRESNAARKKQPAADPPLPDAFDALAARYAAHGYTLTSEARDGVRWYTTGKPGMVGITRPQWAGVLDQIAVIERHAAPPPTDDFDAVRNRYVVHGDTPPDPPRTRQLPPDPPAQPPTPEPPTASADTEFWAAQGETISAHYWHAEGSIYKARCGRHSTTEPPFRVIGRRCPACDRAIDIDMAQQLDPAHVERREEQIEADRIPEAGMHAPADDRRLDPSQYVAAMERVGALRGCIVAGALDEANAHIAALKAIIDAT